MVGRNAPLVSRYGGRMYAGFLPIRLTSASSTLVISLRICDSLILPMWPWVLRGVSL